MTAWGGIVGVTSWLLLAVGCNDTPVVSNLDDDDDNNKPGQSSSGSSGSSSSGSSGSSSSSSGTSEPPLECELGQWDDDGDANTACVPWRTCGEGEFVREEGSATADRVCAPVTACGEGSYETSPATATSDRVCAPCAAGSWDDDGDASTACVPWTACTAGQQVSVPGATNTDVTCEACAAGSFSSDGSACVAWSECAAGTFLQTPGTDQADASCGACAEGTWSAGGEATSCAPWQAVCVPGEFVAAAPSAAHDRICQACAPDGFASYTENAAQCQSTLVAFSGGAQHTCALDAQGYASCWGTANGGRVGVASNAQQNRPVSLEALGALTHISAGAAHTCAINLAGAVLCWGNNTVGQLGRGDVVSGWEAREATLAHRAVQLSAGNQHTCAITEADELWCWGSNADGQLGTGAKGGSVLEPTLVGVGYKSVGAGTSHTCALKADGSVWCVGRNNSGQLGTGSTAAEALDWVQASGLNGVEQIAVGAAFACARLADGGVSCWGQASSGQLGRVTNTTNFRAAAPVDGVTEAATISVGSAHACALRHDGSVWCWGANADGQLGRATADLPAQRSAAAVTDLAPVRRLGVGGDHSCARLESGRALCWGKNGTGQLGDGGTPGGITPRAVFGW